MAGTTPDEVVKYRRMMTDCIEGATELLANGVTRESFLAVMKRRKEIIDGMAHQIRGAMPATGKKVACSDRCHYCCFQNIQTTPAEVAYIIMMAEEQLPRIRQRSAEIAPKVAAVSEEKRFAQSIPCPLLDVRSCSVYEFRPDICRAWMSVSKTACLSEWNARKSDGPEHAVPIILQPIQIGEMVSIGVEVALKRKGLATGRYELSLALTVMAQPGVVDSWLEGGDPFFGIPEHKNRFNDRKFSLMLDEMV